ncbi:hypothetical protein HZS_3167 [Henneguya salminicola]|nr:hypothetical protein HZS_3167 [Henneguya salminicola]
MAKLVAYLGFEYNLNNKVKTTCYYKCSARLIVRDDGKATIKGEHLCKKCEQKKMQLNADNLLDPRLRSTQDGRRFVRRVWHGDIDDVDHTIIISASEESCSVLLQQGDISIDATFKTCPPIYKQCLICLMTGKGETLYWITLQERIGILHWRWTSKLIIIDFEIGLGLIKAASPNRAVVERAANFLESRITPKTKSWICFFKYFRSTWLTRYPVEIWNVCGVENDLIWRINNVLERYNRRLNEQFSTPPSTMAQSREVLIN